MSPYQSFQTVQRARAEAAVKALQGAGEKVRVEEKGDWIHIYLA